MEKCSDGHEESDGNLWVVLECLNSNARMRVNGNTNEVENKKGNARAQNILIKGEPLTQFTPYSLLFETTQMSL